MKSTFGSALTAGALALGLIAGLTPAKADVFRTAIAVAENQADYENNVALLPTFAELLKKGTGVKAVYAGTDAAKLTVTTTSVWANEADVASVTGTAEWKAAAAKIKAKSYAGEVFQLIP